MRSRARPSLRKIPSNARVAAYALGTAVLATVNASPSSAQNAALNALQNGSEGAAPRSRWSLLANTTLSSSLHSFGDPNHNASADLWLMPSYILAQKWRVMGVLVVGKDLTGERLASVSRTDLGLIWTGVPLNPFLRFTAASGVRLPFATDARARQSLVTAVRVSPRLLLSLDAAGLPSLSAFYENSVLLNFHEFSTATTGRPNTQLSWNQTVSGTWAPGEKFSSTTTFGWLNAWTYAGTHTNSFSLDQQFSWQFTPRLGVSLGVGNSGSPLKPNGSESAISLINPDTSQAYCSFSLNL